MTSFGQPRDVSWGDLLPITTPSPPQPGFQREKAEGHKGGAPGHTARWAAPVHGVSPARLGADPAADQALPRGPGPPPSPQPLRAAPACAVLRGIYRFATNAEKGDSPV